MANENESAKYCRYLKEYFEEDDRNVILLEKIESIFEFSILKAEAVYTFMYESNHMSSLKDEFNHNSNNILFCINNLNEIIDKQIDKNEIYKKVRLFDDSAYIPIEMNKDFFIREFENKKNIDFRSFYRTIVKYIILLSISLDWKNKDLTIGKIKDSLFNNINFYNGYNFLYRGQSQYSWDLIPSLIRGYSKKSKKDGVVIDNNELYELYSKTNMIKDYNRFKKNNIESGKDIDYDFLSFMQHSISYSPLIDFTDDENVALSFAIQRSDINTFLQKDSSVFVIDMNQVKDVKYSEQDIDRIIKNFKIYFLSKKIRVGTTMDVVDNKGIITHLDFTTLKAVKDHLTPNYIILNSLTNDRMRYQKGCFILFYDYVSVNGNMLYDLAKGLNILKIKITPDMKQKLKIDKCYSIGYLLNPYQIFRD